MQPRAGEMEVGGEEGKNLDRLLATRSKRARATNKTTRSFSSASVLFLGPFLFDSIP